jgi:hypothetical protein
MIFNNYLKNTIVNRCVLFPPYMASARAVLARLGVRVSSVDDAQLQEIMAGLSSGSSGSYSSPGSASSGSMYGSGGEAEAALSASAASASGTSLSTSAGGTSGEAGGAGSSSTDTGLSLPSELLAALASPVPAWRGFGRLGEQQALAGVGAAAPAPLDLHTECVGLCCPPCPLPAPALSSPPLPHPPPPHPQHHTGHLASGTSAA